MAIGSGGALRAGMMVRGDGIHGKQEGAMGPRIRELPRGLFLCRAAAVYFC
jgi:hypothetical protein